MQNLNDIAEFFINGDSAPNRCFDYHYQGFDLDPLAADFDQNGVVDGRDFLVWHRGFGFGEALADGDADADVDDLAIWQELYGNFAPHGQIALNVPESTSMLLATKTLLAVRPRFILVMTYDRLCD